MELSRNRNCCSNEMKNIASGELVEISESPMDILLSTEYSARNTPEELNVKKKSNTKPRNNRKRCLPSDEESENEFEDVLMPENVTNEISVKSLTRRSAIRDSIDQDIRRHVSLLWKRFVKNQALALRKVHMICCLGRGLFLSRACDYFYVQSFALSVVPLHLTTDGIIAINDAQGKRKARQKSKKSSETVRYHIEQILKWYRKTFNVADASTNRPVESVLDLFMKKTVSSKARFIQGLVSIFRSLRIPARIVIHFSPKAMNAVDIEGNSKAKAVKVDSSSSSSSSGRASRKEAVDKYLYMNIVPFELDSSECFDMWVEVFDSDLSKWLCVDPYSLNLCDPQHIEEMLNFSSRTTKCTFIAAYTVAFDADDGIYDVTPRYASKTLHTSTRRERSPTEIEPWWQQTLSRYKKSGKMTETEEAELVRLSSAEFHSVPTTKAEMQSHPLYVLASQIHKYEALYPPDAKPVAKLNGESVFLRSNVKAMHTESKWLQEGRAIRADESPYKEVRSNKRARHPDAPVSLSGLYGEWQTKLFVPPPISDDKIPRNKFGNYEMFKPWMLPVGACHVKLPGAQLIARRLGIDYAPAVVGWDFHCGVSHPYTDGIILPEKFRVQLERAWRDEQQAAEMTKEVRKAERVLLNWKRMVKALLLGERLKQRYL